MAVRKRECSSSRSDPSDVRITVVGNADVLCHADVEDELPLLAPAITKKSRVTGILPVDSTVAELIALANQELIGRILEFQETLKEAQEQLKSRPKF